MRNQYPFSGGARGKGYDPAIGDDPFNVAALLRREPDMVLRREAAKKNGGPRARLAARILAARIANRRAVETAARIGDGPARAAAANRAAYARRAYFGRAA